MQNQEGEDSGSKNGGLLEDKEPKLKSDFNLSQDSDEEAPEIKRDKFIQEFNSHRDLEDSQMIHEKDQKINDFKKRSESDLENIYTNQRSNKDSKDQQNPGLILSTREAQDEKEPLSSARNLLSTNRERNSGFKLPAQLEQINEVKEVDLSNIDHQQMSELSVDLNQKKFSALQDASVQKSKLEKDQGNFFDLEQFQMK